MKFLFIFVGKTKDKSLNGLIKEYLNRINRYLPSQILEIKEDKNISSKDQQKIIQRESENLEKHISKGTFTISFDEVGKQRSTGEFSSMILRIMNSGTKQINFIIGGPFGLSNEIKQKSQEIISISKLTFTHDIARLLVLEQVYRALTIINGEKYHH